MRKNNNNDRYISIEQSLRDSLCEVQMIRSGKLPKKSWRDVYQQHKDKVDVI